MSRFLLILDVHHQNQHLGFLNVQEVVTDFLPRLGDKVWLSDGHPAREYINLSPIHRGATVEKVAHWASDPNSADDSLSCQVQAQVNIEEISGFDLDVLTSSPHWVTASNRALS